MYYYYSHLKTQTNLHSNIWQMVKTKKFSGTNFFILGTFNIHFLSNGLVVSVKIFYNFFLIGSNYAKKVSMLNLSCGGGNLGISNPQKMLTLWETIQFSLMYDFGSIKSIVSPKKNLSCVSPTFYVILCHVASHNAFLINKKQPQIW